jgi:hypothetical protein
MKRQVRILIGVVASGLLVFGVMVIGLEYARYRVEVGHNQPAELDALRTIIGSALLLAGIILFATSNKLAAVFTDDDDND